MTIFESYRRSP